MKLHLTHATSYDFQTELYEPLKQTLATNHDVFFPHDKIDDGIKTKDRIKQCDAVLAEVSYPSTGQGIELGWADAFAIPIICFYRTGAKPSGSLRYISDVFIEYSSPEDMAAKVSRYFNT